jgi:hypothetical protein
LCGVPWRGACCPAQEMWMSSRVRGAWRGCGGPCWWRLLAAGLWGALLVAAACSGVVGGPVGGGCLQRGHAWLEAARHELSLLTGSSAEHAALICSSSWTAESHLATQRVLPPIWPVSPGVYMHVESAPPATRVRHAALHPAWAPPPGRICSLASVPTSPHAGCAPRCQAVRLASI